MRNAIALYVLLAVLGGAARAAEVVPIRIDVSARRQTVAGFGGTVGWIYPSEEKLEEVADLLFEDLGASILRLSALTRNGDDTDEGSPEVENDNDDPESIDWQRLDFEACEKEQARIARAAAKRGVTTFVAASWSPPGWMKAAGSRKWGGELEKGNEAELAELWTAYLLWMRRHGRVTVGGVSLQNEPEVSRPYPTAEFPPEDLNRACRAFLARARKEKLRPALLFPEVSQLGHLEPYLKAADKDVVAACGAISVHAYDLSTDFYDLKPYREAWLRTAALVRPLRKPLWMTEFSNYSGAFSGKQSGTWPEALAWARHVHLALTAGQCSAVLFWGLYFDKKGEALVYARANKAREYEITPKFYTSKNYFRFVRPGAVRVACSPDEGTLEASAYWHVKRHELTAVIINPGDDEVMAGLEVKGLAEPRKTSMFRTSRDENCERKDPERERALRAALRFPAQSVTTLVFEFDPQDPPRP